MQKIRNPVIPQPKVEIRELFGLKAFYEKILSPTEQEFFLLFVIEHHTLKETREILDWKFPKFRKYKIKTINKVLLYGNRQTKLFFLENAGYQRRVKIKFTHKFLTRDQRYLIDNNLKGKRRFISVDTWQKIRQQQK